MSIVEQLRQKRRRLDAPTNITLASGETLPCRRLLRLLPGKRATMKSQWQGRPVLLKLMLDTFSGRRNLRRELVNHHTLKAEGIATPELLLATRCRDGAHVLLFEYLQTAQTLGTLWQKQSDRRPEIAALGLRLISQMHNKGCFQTDPHLDNFLLQDDCLYVVDLAAVRHRKNTGYGQRQRENLALFLAQFAPLPRRIVMGCLETHYAEAAADCKLEKAIEKAWRWRKSDYLKKCCRDSDEVALRTSWRQTAAWKRTQYSDDLASFLQQPDAWIEKGKVLQGSSLSTVIHTEMGEQPVVIKRHNIKHLGHWLLRRCFYSKSRVNWRNAHLLKISGIATPEPVAFVEERWGPLCFRGYYICAFSDFPTAEKKYKSQAPTRQELIWFEEFVSNMRETRLFFSDLTPFNLLVTDKGISLIDLDTLKECSSDKSRSFKRRSARDRRCFLQNWGDKPELLKLLMEKNSHHEEIGNAGK